MNDKQRRLAEYFRKLADPVPPPKDITEEVFVPEQPQIGNTPSVSPSKSASVGEMLEKLRERKKNTNVEESLFESAAVGVVSSNLSMFTSSKTLEHSVPIEQSITDDVIEAAVSATEKALNDKEMNQFEQDVFEAIIIPYKRPVLDITNDDFSAPPPDWEFLNNFRDRIKMILSSIGRIDIPELITAPYAGTGFFAGKGLLMTNRHVARHFTQGVGAGAKYVTLQTGLSASVDSKYEVGAPGTGEGTKKYKVKEVLLVHPHWDVAILKVEAESDENPPEGLFLAKHAPINFESGAAMQNIIVVGYPMIDIRGDIPQQINIFRNIFGRKRLMPGFLTGYDDVKTKWERTLHAATHDASTLGGNSGSAVIDLLTGNVLALHFGGVYLKANYGVPMWELAQDPHIIDLGLNFVDDIDAEATDAPATDPPIWFDAWKTVKTILPEESPSVTATTASHSSPASTSSGSGKPTTETPLLPVAPDWFEHVSNAQLVEAMRRDSASTERLIRETLLTNEADDLINDLKLSIAQRDGAATVEEGILDYLLGTAQTDPTLPEIIYLHGIMGGHLASHEGIGGRVWLSPLAFVAGRVAHRLALTDDGESDRTPNQTLFPDGHIRFVYEKSARKWRMSGFVVHEFSFDWRKPLINSADRLHFFIESLRLERPNKKFALVCHSMGGLVAALYAARHPEWSSRVSQAIFMGAPLRGSYVPIEALLGTYALFSKFDLVDRLAAHKDYIAMACTLPGLIDMLPDPEIFPDAAPLYERATWQKDIAPTQLWLDQSRRVKRLLATSPILDGAHLIVSPDHPTVNDIRIVSGQLQSGRQDKRGDGTVPLRSAAALGIANTKIYRASYGHGDLPREPAVINAVADLLKEGRCDLSPLAESIITDTNSIFNVVTESIISGAKAAKSLEESISADGLTLRLQQGIFTQRDADFLLSQERAELS